MGRKSKWPVGITERKLPSGEARFQLAFSYRGKAFRKLTQLPVTRQNAKYLERLRASIYIEIENGTFRFGKYWPDSKEAKLYDDETTHEHLIRDALREMIAEMRQLLPVEEGTIDWYETLSETQIIPAFGHLRLVDLKIEHLERWIKSLNVRKTTVISYLQPLRRLIKAAVRKRQLPYDPTALIDYNQLIPKAQRTTRQESEKIDPFSVSEIHRLVGGAFPWSRNALLFNFFVGLRISELISLRWENIDLDRRIAVINESKDTMGRTKGTKTDSTRIVELKDVAFDAAIAQRRLIPDATHLCVNRYGRPFTNWRTFRMHWIKILNRAEVRYRSPYQMRHTFASMMLSRGENVLWVANMMGHRSFTMLEKHYASWIPQNRTEIAHEQTRFLDLLELPST